METIQHLATHLQEVLILEAAQVSREHGLQKRDSKLAEGRFLQVMVVGCLAHPQPSLEQLAQIAAVCEAAVHPQAIDERLTETAAVALESAVGSGRATSRFGEALGPGDLPAVFGRPDPGQHRRDLAR